MMIAFYIICSVVTIVGVWLWVCALIKDVDPDPGPSILIVALIVGWGLIGCLPPMRLETDSFINLSGYHIYDDKTITVYFHDGETRTSVSRDLERANLLKSGKAVVKVEREYNAYGFNLGYRYSIIDNTIKQDNED